MIFYDRNFVYCQHKQSLWRHATLQNLRTKKWKKILKTHFYTNYVIRESQAKTSVHPIKKGRAKRGKAALESWGQAKDVAPWRSSSRTFTALRHAMWPIRVRHSCIKTFITQQPSSDPVVEWVASRRWFWCGPGAGSPLPVANLWWNFYSFTLPHCSWAVGVLT